MIFHDRQQAGRALARALQDQADLTGALILALPRGGLPVAAEVARALRLQLDILVVRKVGVPGDEELAMGAVASGGVVFLNSSVIRAFSIGQKVVEAAISRERQEAERRAAIYRAERQPKEINGRTVIVIDDGLATGSTMTAAVRALRPVARRICVAVPVGAASTVHQLSQQVDQLVCLDAPLHLSAVGEHYRNFDPVSEEECRTLFASFRTDGSVPTEDNSTKS